jgi:site-specific recombinase XerD
MDALLNAPDQSTQQGCRDHTLLLFLYNTGARADEVAQIKIADHPLYPKAFTKSSQQGEINTAFGPVFN